MQGAQWTACGLGASMWPLPCPCPWFLLLLVLRSRLVRPVPRPGLGDSTRGPATPLGAASVSCWAGCRDPMSPETPGHRDLGRRRAAPGSVPAAEHLCGLPWQGCHHTSDTRDPVGRVSQNLSALRAWLSELRPAPGCQGRCAARPGARGSSLRWPGVAFKLLGACPARSVAGASCFLMGEGFPTTARTPVPRAAKGSVDVTCSFPCRRVGGRHQGGCAVRSHVAGRSTPGVSWALALWLESASWRWEGGARPGARALSSGLLASPRAE